MRFEVLGQPQGKGRPRFTHTGKYSRAYTPAKTKSYEQEIAWAYKSQGGKYLDGEISMTVIAVYKIPKSFSKAKRAQAIAMQLKPQTKPDIDNIAKVVCDSLNGVAYKDDNQITSLFLKKFYGEEPKLIIYIEEIL